MTDDSFGESVSFLVNYNTRSRLCTWEKDPLFEFDKGVSIQVGRDMLVFISDVHPMPVVQYSNILHQSDLRKTKLKAAGFGRKHF